MRLAPTCAVLLTMGILHAQPQPEAPDPPSRVARLNFLAGPVSFQPASLDTWTSATVNYPLTTGDHLYTDTGARAEMHIGPNAIRLNDRTNFGFLNLDDRTVQMRFTEGAMEVRLRALDDEDLYEVDTPNGAITLLRTGDYRIDTYPDRNATLISVFSGEVEVTSNGVSFAVHPRETAWFTDGPPEVRGLNQPDAFDDFTADRNAGEDRLPSPEHVPMSMAGYEDLSASGTWSEVPDYGWVWAPPVQADWAPYHYGHWAWVEPWGWTWIDDAPWGFAPFHYGRWAFVNARWVWVPGRFVARPVYAPALVVFVGGPRFGVSIGLGGGVAWFPLGPREVYRPAYRVSNTYITNINITHVTNVNVINNVNITNVRYANQNVRSAVTAVPQGVFVSARSVSGSAVRISPQEMAQAQVLGHAPSVVPQRESLLGPNANARLARPSAAVMSRQVVVRATPPPASVSFEARQTALSQNQGRPLAPEQIAQIRQQQPSAVVNRAPVRIVGPVTPRAVNPTPENAVQAPPRPPSRFDSRPPGLGAPQARPQSSFEQPRPAERPTDRAITPPPVQPRPQPIERPAPAVQQPRPQPAARPAPEARPEPAARPVQREQARPAPEARPATKREEPKREEPRKDDRKESRQ